MRILYVGNLAGSSKGLQLRDAIAEVGCDVVSINSVALAINGEERRASLFERVLSKAKLPADSAHTNREIVEEVASCRPDLLFINKVLHVHPWTLARVRELSPRTRLVWYSEDDMFAKHNQSSFFVACLPLFDDVVTTKSYNVEHELPSLGARRVHFVDQCFHRDLHRPVVVSHQDHQNLGGEIGFIGTFEAERGRSLLRIAEAGYSVRVWGNSWPEHWRNRHPNLVVEGRGLGAEDYVRAICSTGINLGFLRKANRDLQTGRSIEIPACGAFMLAERTEEHERLFEPGREAAYFADDDELLRQVRRYRDPELRAPIAVAGRERCVRSGYDYHSRMKDLLGRILTL